MVSIPHAADPENVHPVTRPEWEQKWHGGADARQLPEVEQGGSLARELSDHVCERFQTLRHFAGRDQCSYKRYATLIFLRRGKWKEDLS